VSLPENITLHQDIDEADMPIKGDASQLYQVLINLMNNARDALETTVNPTITVKLKLFEPDGTFLARRSWFKPGTYAHLSVADNGIGIPADQIKHLFEPFFTTKEQGKGTGLGLAMVYGAVKVHCGFIEAESTAGESTKFHIYLPLEHRPVSAPAATPIEPVHGHGEWVLVADDDPAVLSTTASVLEAFGYTVLTAADGTEAMDQFETYQSDIAIALLDVVMPNGGGQRVADHIRQIRPGTPIILMTGYDREHVLPVVDQGTRILTLNKPLQLDALSHKIRELLDTGSPTQSH